MRGASLEGSVEIEEFTLLFKSSREFFFAPVIEYGPLAEWKEIAGSGQEMQDVFWYIKEAIDAYFDGRPFQVTVKAGCIIGTKQAPRELEVELHIEDMPFDADTNVEIDEDLPVPPRKIAAGSVRLADVAEDEDEDEIEELSPGDDMVIIDEDSLEEHDLDAFIEGRKRPSHLDE